MTPAEIVIDASALLRGMLAEASQAETIIAEVSNGHVRAHAPDLIGPETTHALQRLARAGRLDLEDARQLVDQTERLPIVRHPSLGHAPAAFELARATELSAYDAFYAVLAETLQIPLVTADRRLADAVEQAVLVGGAS